MYITLRIPRQALCSPHKQSLNSSRNLGAGFGTRLRHSLPSFRFRATAPHRPARQIRTTAVDRRPLTEVVAYVHLQYGHTFLYSTGTVEAVTGS